MPARLRQQGSLARATLLAIGMVIALRVVLGLVVAISCGGGCNDQGVDWYGSPPVTSGWEGFLVGPWDRIDAVYYAQIVAHGYSPPGPANGPVGVFFPLFPLLSRAVLPLAGGDPVLAGLLVNSALAAVALVLLFRLVEIDLGSASAHRTLVVVGVGPAIFFLLAPLSEAAFFTFTVAAVLAIRRDRVALAGLLAAAATLSRLQGILVEIPLVIETVRQARAQRAMGGPPLRWSHGTLALAPLCLLGFQWYIGGHGYPGGLLRAEQVYWHAHSVFPGVAVWDGVRFAVSRADVPELVNLLAVVALMVTVTLMWRRLRPADTAYAAASLLVIVSHEAGFSPLMSALRFAATAYPAWILLGAVLPSRRALARASLVLAGFTLLVAGGVSGYHMVQ